MSTKKALADLEDKHDSLREDQLETKKEYIQLKKDYDSLYADRTHTLETKAEQAHQDQI